MAAAVIAGTAQHWMEKWDVVGTEGHSSPDQLVLWQHLHVHAHAILTCIQ